MSATDTFETNILKLIFTNVTLAGIGDGAGLIKSTADGVFYINLSTGTLDDTHIANQTETTYTSYARASIARSTSGWTVTNDTADNDAALTFPAGTGGSGTVTDFGIGDGASGATTMHFYGVLDASLVVGSGVTPEFAAGALNITAA